MDGTAESLLGPLSGLNRILKLGSLDDHPVVKETTAVFSLKGSTPGTSIF